ncbi:MAG TPA: DUF3386 family protein [Pirellulales bacterium]|nr:DUF3386 family protein [Pirellulales bacterium]
MLNLARWLFGGLLILLLAARAQPAQAHFLFIRITPPAEGGRAAEVYFSEHATAGDPRFIDKVAHTTLWRQTTPGERLRLWFGDDDVQHPLGRLLLFDGGDFASSYRVKDRQISVVNRALGRQNMTITVLDNQRTADGHFLPRSYTVHYWDDAGGRLLRSEAIDDRWTTVGGFDLPAAHTVTVSTDVGQSVRSFTMSEHHLLAGSGGEALE